MSVHGEAVARDIRREFAEAALPVTAEEDEAFVALLRTYDPSLLPDIPVDVIIAAQKVTTYFALKGVRTWALAGCRNRF